MSASEQVFFFIGVFTSTVGAFALCCLLVWQGLEWWIKANDLRAPLTKFYIDQLKARRKNIPG